VSGTMLPTSTPNRSGDTPETLDFPLPWTHDFEGQFGAPRFPPSRRGFLTLGSPTGKQGIRVRTPGTAEFLLEGL